MSAWRWQNFSGSDERTTKLLASWSINGAPATATVLKADRVWAVDDVVIKTAPAYRLRRAAASWARLAPIPSPEPLVLGTNGKRGIMAMRRCPGVPLEQAWHESAARDALANLIASLLQRRIIHGDLTLRNVLWDGKHLSLIDLDGLRPRLHGMVWRRHLVRTWAWIYHRSTARDLVRAAHDRCCTALGLGELDRRWATVMKAERAIDKQMQRRPPRRQRSASSK